MGFTTYINLVASLIMLIHRIQELLKSENLEEGRVPRTVECELSEDLVDSCIPGDIVTVTGIVKVINNYMDVGGGNVICVPAYPFFCLRIERFCHKPFWLFRSLVLLIIGYSAAVQSFPVLQ